MQLDPAGIHLSHYRGGIAITGSSLDGAVEHFTPSRSRPAHPLHVTLVNAEEYKRIGSPALSDIARDCRLDNVYVLGETAHRSRKEPSGGVRWLVFVWNHADEWRKIRGLGWKAYHVTLSDADNHSIDKGLSSLFVGEMQVWEDILDGIKDLGDVGMDHVYIAAREQKHPMSNSLAELMALSFPDCFRSYLRYAEAITTSHPKAAQLCLARAAALHPDLIPKIATRMRQTRSAVSYGPSATAQDLIGIPPAIIHEITKPWTADLHHALAGFFWSAPTVSRERQHFSEYEMARFFSVLYPGRLAGMSTPRNRDDIEVLAKYGFTHILSLTAETPLPDAWFSRTTMSHVFVPIENLRVPTCAEMDIVYERFITGGNWLVHCGGGVGRAGTVLACLVAMLGLEPAVETAFGSEPKLDARTAITALRVARPRSLESREQEDFVAKWISHRWRMVNTVDNTSEPVTSLQVEPAARPINWDQSVVLILVGRPGSGKSWFASALAKRRRAGTTVVISQDDTRSRSACENALGHRHPPETLLILDRCNPSAAERKEWLGLLTTERQVIGVYFDYQTDLCRHRADRRLDHPTIRPGRAGRVIKDFDKRMEAPTLIEGLYAVYTVTSFAASRELLARLAPRPDPPIIKFPRTPHLLDLGSTSSDDEIRLGFTTLTGRLTVEEKIDGANMGFSLSFDGNILVQNRSHWVTAKDHAQFKPLTVWLERHEAALRQVLGKDEQFPERYILYGEWMVARHSIHYTRLPAPFIAFDLYDRHLGTFAARKALAAVLEGTGISQVPLITEADTLSRTEVLNMLQQPSAFGEARREGVYIRFEDAERSRTIDRGKVVRGDFIAGNEHWSRGSIVLNRYSTTTQHRCAAPDM